MNTIMISKKNKDKNKDKNKEKNKYTRKNHSTISFNHRNIEFDKTYIISHGKNRLGLKFNILADILNSYGLQKTTNPESNPTFLYLNLLDNNRYDKSYYNTNAMIFNLLNDSKIIITDKYNLYKAFQKQFPDKCAKYMAKSWELKTFLSNSTLMKKITNDGKIMIVKPVGTGAMAGQGITIVSDKHSLEIARRRVAKYKNAMISEYLVNPYLFEGKKFHIRAYYMVLVAEENHIKMVQTKLFPFGKILTAKDKYINGNWENTDVHDTHFESTGRDIYFPDDLPTIEERHIFTREIFPEMGRCLRFISEIISPVIEKYNTCQYGYEIFGCDFMVIHKGNPSNPSRVQVKLLEINDKVGYLNAAYNKAEQLSKLFFNQIKTGILNPILGRSQLEDSDSDADFWDYIYRKPL